MLRFSKMQLDIGRVVLAAETVSITSKVLERCFLGNVSVSRDEILSRTMLPGSRAVTPFDWMFSNNNIIIIIINFILTQYTSMRVYKCQYFFTILLLEGPGWK